MQFSLPGRLIALIQVLFFFFVAFLSFKVLQKRGLWLFALLLLIPIAIGSFVEAFITHTKFISGGTNHAAIKCLLFGENCKKNQQSKSEGMSIEDWENRTSQTMPVNNTKNKI